MRQRRYAGLELGASNHGERPIRLLHAALWNNVGQREQAFVVAVPAPTHASCFLDLLALRIWGNGMDTRDKAVSLVGYLLFVAVAVALIAGVLASF